MQAGDIERWDFKIEMAELKWNNETWFCVWILFRPSFSGMWLLSRARIKPKQR